MCKHGRPDELTVLGLAKTSRLRQAAWCQTGQEASRTLILLLALEETPKVGRKDAGDPTSPNDVTQNGKGVRVCLAVLPELPGVEGCVNDGIDPLPHQLGQALRELGHILTDALFRIGDHFVHIGQLVIHLQRWAGGLVAGSDSGSFGSVSTDQVLVREPAYICRKVPCHRFQGLQEVWQAEGDATGPAEGLVWSLHVQMAQHCSAQKARLRKCAPRLDQCSCVHTAQRTKFPLRDVQAADVPDSHIVGWMTVSNLSLRLGIVTSAMLSEWGFDTTSRLGQSL